jgi:hypothetical protein
MGLESFSIAELGGLITVSSGALATVLFALSKSKCTKIACCGCACERPIEAIVRDLDEGGDDVAGQP